MPNFLLNRGGAGKSLTRVETAALVSDLINQLVDITRSYDRLLQTSDDLGPIGEELLEQQKTTRTDIAKLSELVLSAGGTPPRHGAGNVPEAEGEELIRAMDRAERSFRDALEEQLGRRLQKLTLAVLEKVMANTKDRIARIARLAERYGVPIG